MISESLKYDISKGYDEGEIIQNKMSSFIFSVFLYLFKQNVILCIAHVQKKNMKKEKKKV